MFYTVKSKDGNGFAFLRMHKETYNYIINGKEITFRYQGTKNLIPLPVGMNVKMLGVNFKMTEPIALKTLRKRGKSWYNYKTMRYSCKGYKESFESLLESRLPEFYYKGDKYYTKLLVLHQMYD